MRIAIIDPEVESHLIQKYISSEHTLYTYDDTTYDRSSIDACIIRSQVNIQASLLDLYPALTHIFRVGVGMENIDHDACAARDITVINTPGANSHAVAELCLRYLLTALRHPLTSYTHISQGHIQDRKTYIGKQIGEVQIGFLGFGHVGQAIAKLLTPHQVHGMYYDPYIHTDAYTTIQKVSSVETLIENSDVLLLVAPLLPTTQHTINQTTLTMCKDDIILINMSRGGLIDEGALYDYLRTHTQAQFFADVRADEPEHTDSLQQLLTLPNVTITHHIGALTRTALENMHYFDILASSNSSSGGNIVTEGSRS